MCKGQGGPHNDLYSFPQFRITPQDSGVTESQDVLPFTAIRGCATYCMFRSLAPCADFTQGPSRPRCDELIPPDFGRRHARTQCVPGCQLLREQTRAASDTGNSWATCLGRLVREVFTLVTARSNETRRCRRTVKRCRARVARLRRLNLLFDTHSRHVNIAHTRQTSAQAAGI